MALNSFVQKIQQQERVSFQETIAVINDYYHYTPTAFTNGLGAEQLLNAAGTNEGSCKIFAFASLQCFTPEQTLSLFGDYYWVDVLQHPDAQDHQNIRNFIKFAWAGIEYSGVALVAK